jgi:hypothetical protein
MCFIHGQKLFHNNSLGLYEFLTELKFKLQIEYNICKSNGAVVKCNKYKNCIWWTLVSIVASVNMWTIVRLTKWQINLLQKQKKLNSWTLANNG